MLRIRTFGGCYLERDGRRIEELSAKRKSLALLAVLAAAGARGVTREGMSALLWPESDDEHARTSLKQLVHALRGQLGEPGFLLPTSDLRLDSRHVTSDVADFRVAVSQGDDEVACGLYTGPFLASFHLRNAADLERWMSEERSALARDYARALETLAERAGASGAARDAVALWERLAATEPLSARAATGLMRALEAAGDRSAALQHARDFQRFVGEELGKSPDASVADLANRLLHPDAGVVAAESAATVSAARRSLAVLPFANTSGDATDEHFSDGLTDELIGTIGRIGNLTVIGRTSSFAFKGKTADVRSIAESLRVGAVLEGSVRRAGDKLKIGAQLVRADDGTVVWSEIYDRDARDIFAVQAEIAQAIAGALQVKLVPSSASRPATTDLAAHELYLKGRYFQNRVSTDDLRRSAGYFEQAIARDPRFAQAYAGLADACLLLAILGDGPQEIEVARARVSVKQALALDSTLADAHTSLASLQFVFDWDWASAGRAFERAIAIDPAYGLAHQRYGLYLMYQGHAGKALPVLERARALDPLSPATSMNLGRLHLSANRPTEAVRLLQAALELNPHLALAHEQLGNAHLQLREQELALAAFRRAATGSGPSGAARLAYALAVTGHQAEARQIVDELHQSPSHMHQSSFGLAMAHAGLGNADEAFRWLGKSYADRDAFLHTLKTTPAFDGLHDDPRWRTLLRRMGLSP